MAVTIKKKAEAPSAPQPLKIEYVPLSDLKPYDNNPRVNDHAVEPQRKLLREFGFRVPIVVRQGEIVDGHLRFKAALAEGFETIPVIYADDLTDAQARALRISMNKSAEWAEWNPVLLAQEFEFLREAGIAADLTGFLDTKEIEGVLKEAMKITETSFLDEMIDGASGAPKETPAGPAKHHDADAGLPADPNYVSVSFAMSADSRKRLLKYLSHAREVRGLPTQSHALVAILDEVAAADEKYDA